MPSTIMSMYGSILIAFVLFLSLNFIFYRNKRKQSPQTVLFRPKLLIEGCILFALALLFNVAYTQYFGWNERADSGLEWFLDTIGVIPILIAYYMAYRSFNPKRKNYSMKSSD